MSAADNYREASNRLATAKAKIAEIDRLLTTNTKRARELREKRQAWIRERRAAQLDRDRFAPLHEQQQLAHYMTDPTTDAPPFLRGRHGVTIVIPPTGKDRN